MTQVRSYIFAVYVPIITIIFGLLLSPLMLHRTTTRMVVRSWAKCILGGLRIICGIRYTIHGAQNIPDTPCLVAARHESMWETVAFLLLFKRPVFILKQELVSIPLFGWWCRAQGFIPIDRSAGPRTMLKILKRAQLRAKDGAQIIIFPEGTRMAPGTQGRYQPGVAGLYRTLGLPCVPIVHNSGHYWRHPGTERRPGTIRVKILPIIAPGLQRPAFMACLTDTMTEQYQSLVQYDAPTRQQLRDKSPRRSSQWPLTLSLGIGLALFLAYSFLWHVGASRMTSEVRTFITQQYQQGTHISYDDFDVVGYPFFLRGVLTGMTMEKQQATFSYNAQQIYIEATPFSPENIRLFPAGKQSLSLPGQDDWHITAAQTLISLEKNELRVLLQDIEAVRSGENPRHAKLGHLLANATMLRATDETLHGHFTLQSTDFQITNPQKTDRSSIHLPTIEIIGSVSQIDALMQSASKDSVTSLHTWRDTGGKITLNRFRFSLNDTANQEGAFMVHSSGHVKIDPADYPEGSITIQTENSAKLLTILTAQRMLTQEQATSLESNLSFITAIAGNRAQLSLAMRDGGLHVGPLRIAPLPKIDTSQPQKTE